MSFNPKSTWKLVNEITGNNSNNKDKVETIKVDDNNIY